MLSRQYSLILLATTLLATLQSQSSFAVTVNNPLGRPVIMPYEDSIKQKSGLVQLQAWPFYDPRSVLNFGKVVEVKPGGTDKLLSLLKYQFPEPDWKFVPVGGLKGDFDIKKYFPCTPTFPFPNGQCENSLKTEGAGAVFNLTYTPQEDDPSSNQIRWIQRIIHNYDVVEIDELDIRRSQDNPFYPGANRPNYFYDAPWVPNDDLNRKIYFYAETYLVEEVTTPGSQQRTVNIYDGVRWGWEHIPSNTFKKLPGSLSSGYEKDAFQLKELFPGAKYYAYINNDIPGNQCNPNTLLETYGKNGDTRFNSSENIGLSHPQNEPTFILMLSD